MILRASGLVDAILDGSIDAADKTGLPVFGLIMPTAVPGVDAGILDPRDTYADPAEWETKAQSLAARFVDNFAQYTDTDMGRALVAVGPSWTHGA